MASLSTCRVFLKPQCIWCVLEAKISRWAVPALFTSGIERKELAAPRPSQARIMAILLLIT